MLNNNCEDAPSNSPIVEAQVPSSLPADASQQNAPDSSDEIWYRTQYERLPEYSEISAWICSCDHSIDFSLRAALRYYPEHHCYSTSSRTRFHYLPKNLSLEPVDPAEMPEELRYVTCFRPALPLQLEESEEVIAVGTRIPAGPSNDRAVIVSHVCRNGPTQYLLCFHGSRDLFLLQVPHHSIVKEWPLPKEVAKKYQETIYGPLFQGHKTFLYPSFDAIADFYREEEARKHGQNSLTPASTPQLPSNPWLKKVGNGMVRLISISCRQHLLITPRS